MTPRPEHGKPGANDGGNLDEDLLDFNEMTDAEKASLVDSLLEEMRELFHGYIGGEYPFDEVTFEMFDTLQTLHAIATGSLTIEYFDEADEDDGQDQQYAEFDELAGEPTGNGHTPHDAPGKPGKPGGLGKRGDTGTGSGKRPGGGSGGGNRG